MVVVVVGRGDHVVFCHVVFIGGRGARDISLEATFFEGHLIRERGIFGIHGLGVDNKAFVLRANRRGDIRFL